MAALRAAPCRDWETGTPFECGAPEERRPAYDPIEPEERWLDLDDGRFDCIVRGIPENEKFQSSNSGLSCQISPVSLANMTGGPECASAKCRVRGYFVLLNKCRTMQISPASTKIPVDTPRSVGRSAAITDISESFNKPSVRMFVKLCIIRKVVTLRILKQGCDFSVVCQTFKVAG